MTRLCVIGALLLASAWTAAFAQPADDRWYWLYAYLNGGVVDHVTSTDVGSRHGRATVRMTGSKITIQFDEPALPENRPVLTGRIAKSGTITGMLPDFFYGDAPGPGPVVGEYRRGDSPACWTETIHLQQKFPSPDVWLLYREHGNCMAVGDDKQPADR